MAPDSPPSEIQPLAQEQPFTQREVSTETDLLELGEEVVKKDKHFYNAAADACACCAAAQIKEGKPISAESTCFTVSITKPLASHKGTLVSSIYWQDLDCHKGCVKCSISSMHGKCGPPAKYDEVDSVPVNGPYINVTDSSRGIDVINVSAFNVTKECAHGHCG